MPTDNIHQQSSPPKSNADDLYSMQHDAISKTDDPDLKLILHIIGCVGVLSRLIETNGADLSPLTSTLGTALANSVKQQLQSLMMPLAVSKIGNHRYDSISNTYRLVNFCTSIFPEIARSQNEKTGRSLLHELCLRAKSPKTTTLVRSLFGIDDSIASLLDKHGATPLHYAVRNENVTPDLVEELIRQYPSACTIADKEGMLPLHWAVLRKTTHITIIQQLLKEHKESACRHCHRGNLPLHYAVDNDHVSLEVVKLLFSVYHKSIKTQSHEGFLPLHILLGRVRPNLEVVKYLCDHFPHALEISTASGQTPLHICINQLANIKDPSLYASGDSEKSAWNDTDRFDTTTVDGTRPDSGVSAAAIYVLKRWPGAALVEDSEGYLPIHAALDTDYPDLKLVSILLRKYTESVKIACSDGFLPLHLAVGRNGFPSEDLVRLLVHLYPEAAGVSVTESCPSDEAADPATWTGAWVDVQWTPLSRAMERQLSGLIPLLTDSRWAGAFSGGLVGRLSSSSGALSGFGKYIRSLAPSPSASKKLSLPEAFDEFESCISLITDEMNRRRLHNPLSQESSEQGPRGMQEHHHAQEVDGSSSEAHTYIYEFAENDSGFRKRSSIADGDDGGGNGNGNGIRYKEDAGGEDLEDEKNQQVVPEADALTRSAALYRDGMTALPAGAWIDTSLPLESDLVSRRSDGQKEITQISSTTVFQHEHNSSRVLAMLPNTTQRPALVAAEKTTFEAANGGRRSVSFSTSLHNDSPEKHATRNDERVLNPEKKHVRQQNHHHHHQQQQQVGDGQQNSLASEIIENQQEYSSASFLPTIPPPSKVQSRLLAQLSESVVPAKNSPVLFHKPSQEPGGSLGPVGHVGPDYSPMSSAMQINSIDDITSPGIGLDNLAGYCRAPPASLSVGEGGILTGNPSANSPCGALPSRHHSPRAIEAQASRVFGSLLKPPTRAESLHKLPAISVSRNNQSNGVLKAATALPLVASIDEMLERRWPGIARPDSAAARRKGRPDSAVRRKARPD